MFIVSVMLFIGFVEFIIFVRYGFMNLFERNSFGNSTSNVVVVAKRVLFFVNILCKCVVFVFGCFSMNIGLFCIFV